MEEKTFSEIHNENYTIHIDEEDMEVCLPYYNNLLDPMTIDKDQLNSFLQVDAHMERLPARKLSLYSDVVIDPEKVDPAIDRYTFYSAELGSTKSRNFQELLLKRPNGETLADILAKTSGWWIDIFAPTNHEMQHISKVK